MNGKNPFWRLLDLIAESNSHEAVNDAQVDEIPDIDGEDGDDDEEEAEGEIWLQEKSRDDHMVICSQRI